MHAVWFSGQDHTNQVYGDYKRHLISEHAQDTAFWFGQRNIIVKTIKWILLQIGKLYICIFKVGVIEYL